MVSLFNTVQSSDRAALVKHATSGKDSHLHRSLRAAALQVTERLWTVDNALSVGARDYDPNSTPLAQEFVGARLAAIRRSEAEAFIQELLTRVDAARMAECEATFDKSFTQGDARGVGQCVDDFQDALDWLSQDTSQTSSSSSANLALQLKAYGASIRDQLIAQAPPADCSERTRVWEYPAAVSALIRRAAWSMLAVGAGDPILDWSVDGDRTLGDWLVEQPDGWPSPDALMQYASRLKAYYEQALEQQRNLAAHSWSVEDASTVGVMILADLSFMHSFPQYVSLAMELASENDVALTQTLSSRTRTRDFCSGSALVMGPVLGHLASLSGLGLQSVTLAWGSTSVLWMPPAYATLLLAATAVYGICLPIRYLVDKFWLLPSRVWPLIRESHSRRFFAVDRAFEFPQRMNALTQRNPLIWSDMLAFFPQPPSP